MREKNQRSNYIIFALVCLLVFNTGALLIKLTSDNTGMSQISEAKEVFNEEEDSEGENFFVSLLSNSSSIINLYKNQQYKDEGNSLNNILQDKLSSVLRANFPSIFNLYTSRDDLNEENIEDYNNDPTIVEDFIIIEELEEYQDLIIISDSEGKVSLENLPKPLNIDPITVDKGKPYILIYHTHGTESYSSLENDMHHTTDRKYNVTTIGEILSDTLISNGHKVEHATNYHDIPSYSQSYAQSLKTVEGKLRENSNLKILLDIHRDGYDQNDPTTKKNLDNLLSKSKININGKDVATFFFVVGPDSENKEEVLSFAKYIKAVSDVMYPDLCTGIIIKPVGRYNQYLSDYSALIEIGSNLNTVDEAEETAKLIGEILSMAIDNIENIEN